MSEKEELLEFYHYRLFKKLEPMQQAERFAYLIDLFGKRWFEVHERLLSLYPSLGAWHK